MYNSETSVLCSVNILLHCPEFLECVFSLINYQHSDPEKRAAVKLCSMSFREKQLVISNLKSMHLAHDKMYRGHEKGGWLNPRIKRSHKDDVKYLDL